MKIYLSLVLHNHQPIGNFGWVFQEAYDKAYAPMLACLEAHPTIKVALHYTGPLREWIRANQPEFFPRLRLLVEQGQIEIMTGAYFEPVLVSLKDVDKAGQIRKLTDAVKSDFGYDSTGLWLAERIWEPHLPKSLAEAGVSYTIVDDTHFKAVGYDDNDLLGYFVTEEQGRSLKIFGTSMALRYSIPWKPVDAVISWLRQQYDSRMEYGETKEHPILALMGDDGEKFGLWPGTYQHVWKEGWMERFFEAIEQNSDWLETIPPGEYAERFSSLGRVYLPTSSYDEMGEWSLPPDVAFRLHEVKHALLKDHQDDILRFVRGGHWRSFMVKYPEVNQLHKKALWVSRKVHEMPDGALKTQALDHLWAGQCNCGYWHGTFGGIYLFHIREADYRHLIMAETLSDQLIGSKGIKPNAVVEEVDFDLDGVDDLVASTDQQFLTIAPGIGGTVTEWDFREAQYNLLNVMTRRREGHHKILVDAAERGVVVTPDAPSVSDGDGPRNIHSEEVLAREGRLEQKLIYDAYRRVSFVDHFVGESATIDPYYRANLVEIGDFIAGKYDVVDATSTDNSLNLALTRTGRVEVDSLSLPVMLLKTFKLDVGSRALEVNYRISNRSERNLKTRFGVETNWGLAGGNDAHTTFKTNRGISSFGETVEETEIVEWLISSQLWHIDIAATANHGFTLWRFPLETISLSEGGYERNYQGTSMLMWWPIELPPSENWDVTLKFELRKTD